ncbi:Uncharacterised protein [Amycolatopsis camponoti]|uniref:Uncharacterized protein n=1 Tax=Amycolatopsis camponoti TaxID=2606593 RepID=A0A6I8LPR6_9PSEU|nr:Uncharacterised protein [Amycolatopsis camponoti]
MPEESTERVVELLNAIELTLNSRQIHTNE